MREEERGVRVEKERKKDSSRDLDEKSRDLFMRWKGTASKTEKRRRVAARGRGWERKKTRGGIRVWSRVCLLGFWA